MARLVDRVPENVAGELYVDKSCIDCDACRQIAPEVFSARGDHSFVHRQPEGAAEWRRAEMALIACPTSSIGTVSKRKLDDAVRAFPAPIEDDIYFCGFTAESSFGAWSYLIRREGGNVLVDSPRAAKPLLSRLQELGGVAALFLTHKDDVADHEVFHQRFGCRRILHRDDLEPATRQVEQVLEGREPVTLAPDLVAIPVPGHTRGSMALLYRETYLFTGDHLMWSPSRRRLHVSRSTCWYSFTEQVRSVERLLDFRFRHVLPGHGRPLRTETPEQMRSELERLLERVRASD